MTGVVAHSDGTVYARSDISGFYKRNEDGTWSQMLDYLLPSQENLMGAAGIAISPSDSNIVYAAVGQNTTASGAVLKTINGGSSWTDTGLEVHFGALESGRINGEPIAVSPFDNDTVYVLTKLEGLWKTTDAGASWTKLEGFVPALTETTGFVEFSSINKNVIYVNVSGEGLYITEDGGKTWSVCENSPKTLRRVAQNNSGVLFCSASDGLYRYDGEWTKLYSMGTEESPVGFGGIDINPFDNNHIIAVSSIGKDGNTGLGNNHIIESHDGGVSWTDRLMDHISDNNNYVNPSDFENKLTYSSSIVFDGKREGIVYISEWFGIFETGDIFKSPIMMYRNSQGIENTLNYTVKAMTGKYSVMAGFADINAYAWDDISEMAVKMSKESVIQDTTEIDYCEGNPQFIVRSGVKYAVDGIKYTEMEYSRDGGESWIAANLPSDKFGNYSCAHIAVSANVNDNGTPTIVMSGTDGIYYTIDCGENWTKSSSAINIFSKLYTHNTPMVSDRILNNTFYVYSGGKFYYSGDGGASFTEAKATGLPISGGSVQIESSPYVQGQVLVNIKGNGVYLTNNYGGSFTKLGDFEAPTGVAIGKGLNDGEQAFYVYDSSDNTAGVYASLDQGTTWEKITRGKNNFCSLGDMDADKKDFGIVYLGTSMRGAFSLRWNID